MDENEPDKTNDDTLMIMLEEGIDPVKALEARRKQLARDRAKQEAEQQSANSPILQRLRVAGVNISLAVIEKAESLLKLGCIAFLGWLGSKFLGV